MTLKQRAASRAERAYDTPTGKKVTTVYVVTSSYKNYQRFMSMQPVEPLQYRYLYDDKQLKIALTNLLPLSEVKLLFLPFWFKHPQALNIFKTARSLDMSLLKPLYSDDLSKYLPRNPIRPGVQDD